MIVKLAWRNIWRNRRRSFITVTSISFAVILALFMRSMQLGSYERMIDNAARFYTGYAQIHANGYWDDQTLDNSMEFDSTLMSEVDGMKGVEITVPRVESFALASYGSKTKGAAVLGIDPLREEQLTRVKSKLISGKFLEDGDKGVLISEGLASYLKMGIGDSLVLLGQGFQAMTAAGLYEIQGILKFPIPAQNDQTVLMNLSGAQFLFSMEDRITSLALVIESSDDVDPVVTDLEQRLDTAAFEVLGWRELMPELIESIEIDNVSGRIMLFFLYLVIGFGMFGTFLMMTQERKYEFGVLISIGMKRRLMQWVVFLEMALMSGIGVLTGVAVALPFLIYFYRNPVYLSGESAEAIEKFGVEAAYFFSLDAEIFINQAWAILIMALILGFYPLLVIFKLKPVKAMRES
ncbi:MAG TPA: ABC transporter permease [Flavobacteriales bacterium]|jgi:putative ABC transport system permease protein|nr:ABC transporter permease [Flavobacteriales bacterium]